MATTKAKEISSKPSSGAGGVSAMAEMPLEEFHRRADHYLDTLMNRLEESQEENEGIDVEFSSGVLTLVFPPAGTYVLNKQPPNRQIWLSSPVSGPKRYDWNATHGGGDWVYRRDDSTLSDLVKEELGVDMAEPESKE